jgi:diaminohydroxyphosphoribosylaminopyrimidine deaminase/5-amino-6-(5-phosphoribosylamino)uracil reductase
VEAILALPQIRRVVYGVADPNPSVAGGGAERLRAAGLEVECAESTEAADLLAPWAHLIKHGTPWVTLKIARTSLGSMIPPLGQKTFTSPESLTLAHGLRRNADAILCGSGTILADHPEFTVRRLPDHPEKRRHLVILDRRLRVPAEVLTQARARGFLVHRLSATPSEALRFLGSQGVLEVLIETGPTLTEVFLQEKLWSEKWTFTTTPGEPDRVEQEFNRVHRDR